MYDILMERCRHLDIDFEKMKDKNLVTENGQSNKDDDDDDEDNNKD